jgi:ATP adenylyltransferase/5',5'''-P-1,P-4-tetraphosphate phosphorylase II
MNISDFIDKQLAAWPTAKANYDALSAVRTKYLDIDGVRLGVQYNPKRIISSAAAVDADSISRRACFLCAANRPAEQTAIPFARYDILLNPFPIFPQHLTIADVSHIEQHISSRYIHFLQLAQALPDFVVFYNGPKCGASAPDHVHFQAGSKGFLPIETNVQSLDKTKLSADNGYILWQLTSWPCTTYVIEAETPSIAAKQLEDVCKKLPRRDCDKETIMNLLAWKSDSGYFVCIFPRSKHRPDCYYSDKVESRLLISPASVDLAGMFITPREEDFERITADDVKHIMREVGV